MKCKKEVICPNNLLYCPIYNVLHLHTISFPKAISCLVILEVAKRETIYFIEHLKTNVKSEKNLNSTNIENIAMNFDYLFMRAPRFKWPVNVLSKCENKKRLMAFVPIASSKKMLWQILSRFGLLFFDQIWPWLVSYLATRPPNNTCLNYGKNVMNILSRAN